MAYATINPATGETVKAFETISDEEVWKTLERAQTAFLSWKGVSTDERRQVVSGAAAIMRRDIDRLAGLAVLEMGKLIEQAKGEVELAANILDYYAERADRFLAPTKIEEVDDASWRPFPIGVLMAVEPWNFPYYQLARVAGPQLMVGNVVICKHAGSTPQCAQAFDDLLRDAGAPAGVWTNVYASSDQVAAMIEHDVIKGVTLTGSESAGSAVAGNAGKNLKKAVLELGGSDALIVLEDAPFDSTLDNIIWGRMNNTGQSCVASKRAIIVGKERGERFLAAIAARMSGLKVGDPMDPTTELGPVSSEGAVKQLVDQVERAVKGGARVVTGGKRIDRPGFYLEATVLTDIGPDNPIYTEELFGPALSVYVVGSEDEALELANATSFGLGGSVFTSDLDRGRAVADRIESGMTFVNHPTWTAPELPFGGVNRSGFGRELSMLGFGEFVNRKLLDVSPVGAAPPSGANAG